MNKKNLKKISRAKPNCYKTNTFLIECGRVLKRKQKKINNSKLFSNIVHTQHQNIGKQGR
jgi:hypothetical protein